MMIKAEGDPMKCSQWLRSNPDYIFDESTVIGVIESQKLLPDSHYKAIADREAVKVEINNFIEANNPWKTELPFDLYSEIVKSMSSSGNRNLAIYNRDRIFGNYIEQHRTEQVDELSRRLDYIYCPIQLKTTLITKLLANPNASDSDIHNLYIEGREIVNRKRPK